MKCIEDMPLLGQGPYPYGGGYFAIALLSLVVAILVAGFVVYFVRRQFPRTQSEKTAPQPVKRIAGLVFGCVLVGATAIVIDIATSALEFSERVDVADDGTVIGGGTVRSESVYRFGRAIHVLSMIGFIACGVTIGVRAQAQLWRNGVSWGLVLAGLFALFVG